MQPADSKPLTARERARLESLGRKWATRRATVRDMERFEALARRERMAKRGAAMVQA
jgi:hypothetical protein